MSEFSGKEVDKAAKILRSDNFSGSKEYEHALTVLAAWRNCHENALNIAFKLLRKTASKVDPNAFVAKRPKRAASIRRKLKLNPEMSLRNMQDIGGCRAVVANSKRVYKVVRELKKKKPDLVIRDYVKKPKSSGYRSVHLTGKFSDYTGKPRKIEIQVRSSIQHSWATAVEIVDIFTGQAIKSNKGMPEWEEFFRLCSEVFAYAEDTSFLETTPVQILIERFASEFRDVGMPNAKQAPVESAKKLVRSVERLKVTSRFNAFYEGLRIADEQISKTSFTGYALIQIDTRKSQLTMRLFEDPDEANTEYSRTERKYARQDENVIALLSTDAVGGLPQAYPNYFADATKFLNLLLLMVESYNKYSPPGFFRKLRNVYWRRS